MLRHFSFFPVAFGATNPLTMKSPQVDSMDMPAGQKPRVMKPRDWLTLAGIVGALVFMFALTRFTLPERVKPGTPEFDAYIDHYVGECLKNPQALDKSIATLPTEEQRAAACRTAVLQADRINPDVRPLKRP
jgi:hypothetical protein